jgi:hypothetical protein
MDGLGPEAPAPTRLGAFASEYRFRGITSKCTWPFWPRLLERRPLGLEGYAEQIWNAGALGYSRARSAEGGQQRPRL